MSPNITQDPTAAITIMKNVAEWMQEEGLTVLEWYEVDNMNKEYLYKSMGFERVGTEPEDGFTTAFYEKML